MTYCLYTLDWCVYQELAGLEDRVSWQGERTPRGKGILGSASNDRFC